MKIDELKQALTIKTVSQFAGTVVGVTVVTSKEVVDCVKDVIKQKLKKNPSTTKTTKTPATTQDTETAAETIADKQSERKAETKNADASNGSQNSVESDSKTVPLRQRNLNRTVTRTKKSSEKAAKN
ncbi:hypothetical protein ACFL3G_00415 [Planctomycetota bacterium]